MKDSLGDASLVLGMPPRSGASHAPRTREKPASARSSRSFRGVFALGPRHDQVEVNARLLVCAKGGRHLSSQSLTPSQVLTLLAETPPRIAALCAGLAPEELQMRPTPDEWSANDVLAHLRACADVWGNCIVAMLAQDRPVLRAVNPRTWIKKTNYLELAFRPSLRVFATQRADLLAVLVPLPPEGWSRAATVTGAGKVLERTVLFYVQWLARHERQHVKQVERIVNTMPM